MDGEKFIAAFDKHEKEMDALKKDIMEYDDKIKNGEKLSDGQKEQLEAWRKSLSELRELSKEYIKVILFLIPFFIFFWKWLSFPMKAARRRGQGWDYTRSVPSDLVRTSEEEDRCGSDLSGHPAGSLSFGLSPRIKETPSSITLDGVSL